MGKLKTVMDMTKLKIKANSPMICLVGGVIASAAAVTFTAIAGMKTPSILEQRRAEIEDIESALVDENKEYEYSEEDADHDKRRANKQCIFSLMKAYAPAAGFYCLSLVLFISGNRILEKRNVALATALNSTQAFLAGYRERVASYLGKEKEEEVYRGKYKKSEIDPETGELHEEELVDESVKLTFERIFDKTSSMWVDEEWRNQGILNETQKYLNFTMQERAQYNRIGVVTLNEALKNLGLPECPEGMVVGWWYSDDHRSVIDLGFNNDSNFVNGYSKEVRLVFNVDGDIMQVLKKKHITEMYSLR